MSNKSHRAKPKAPPYTDSTIRSLIQHGPPPLDTSSAHCNSTGHVNPILPKEALIVYQENCPPSQLPIAPHTEKIETISSSLLDRAERNRYVLKYHTEADVQGYVSLLVLDAISFFGALRYTCEVSLELSVFSLRPDIVVLHHEKYGIILVIEVKKPDIPGSKTLSVFKARKVAGQLYDYLMGMFHMGNATPFGILSTYDYMTIVWLNNTDSNDIMRDQSRKLSFPYSVDGEKNENGENNENGDKPDGVRKISPPPFSIVKAVPSVSDGIVEEDDPQADPSTKEDFEREINYSPRYDHTASFKAVLLALRCGLEAAKERSERKIPRHGDDVQGTCALCHSTGISWKNISMTIDYMKSPSPQTKSLYLWKDLGRGSSGRAFLAFNSNGKTCVVKFFHYQRSEVPNDNDPVALEYLKNRSFSQAEKERKLWHLMYHDYRRAVRIMELNDTYALVMPYFDPLPCNERIDSIKQIRKELIRFKENGYKYGDNDLRWRHVGKRGSNLSFIDLGSLVKDDKVTDADVDEQVRMLQDTA